MTGRNTNLQSRDQLAVNIQIYILKESYLMSVKSVPMKIDRTLLLVASAFLKACPRQNRKLNSHISHSAYAATMTEPIMVV